MTIIIAALISAIVPAAVGVYLSRRVNANSRTMNSIHVLVNGRMREAIARITELEEGLTELSAALGRMRHDGTDKKSVIDRATAKIEEVHGPETDN